AAIFSAVLITLIVDSKTLLEQDKTEVLVDAVVFLMNNLANGTHRPYTPPKFQPSTQSILVNCFFFASLCLSISTALAAVLAMQWVTDYGAVTRRAGSTPEERVKRRHFRYQGGQDWRMDGIIGALPIALHLSVLLFFVGLIVWMWDVHHSVFAVVFICGAVAVLFYMLTTILAIFYPSCPYRTPLASWTYILLRLLVRVLFPSSWLATPTQELKSDEEKGVASGAGLLSKLRLFVTPLLSRLAPSSLASRDNGYIRHSDKGLMANSLVWLSKQLPISPDIYRRLLVFIDGFSVFVEDPEAHGPDVPWGEIFRALGVIYQSFIEVPGVPGIKEEDFVEFARRTYCLSQPGMSDVLNSCSRGSREEATLRNSIFPIRLLRAWTKSTSSHTSDALRRQRFSDEVVLHDLISGASSSSQDLVEIWYGLLDDEGKTTERILPMILDSLKRPGTEEKRVQRRDTCLYLISTGHLPWESTVPFYSGTPFEKNVPSNSLVRRLRAIDWVKSLEGHPQKAVILEHLGDLPGYLSMKLLLIEKKFTEEEENELKRVGLDGLSGWTRPEEMLFSALLAFDGLVCNAESPEVKQRLIEWTLRVICRDLMDSNVWLESKCSEGEKERMQWLSNPPLRLIACATLDIEWKEEWTPDLLTAREALYGWVWQRVSQVCFRRSPFFDGDQAFLWQLRLRLWIHFRPAITSIYLYDITRGIASLKRVIQELQSSRLGIDNAADFFLALFHLNCAYTWDDDDKYVSSSSTFIPSVLIQDTTSIRKGKYPTECIEYLSSICDEISADPARLIRLLIELIRADINHNPKHRRPQNLLNLLRHAESQLSGKELHAFSPSCRRLSQYIKVSYQQFEGSWDRIINTDDHDGYGPRRNYAKVDRGELGMVYVRVVTLLEPLETWEGKSKDVSWPRDLLRPTGTKDKPFEEDVQHTNSRKSSEDDDSGQDDEQDYGHHQDQDHNHDDHLGNSDFREVEEPPK
ncbi:hypothetical protein FRC17_004300, partial [Serendipita sp. 399]